MTATRHPESGQFVNHLERAKEYRVEAQIETNTAQDLARAATLCDQEGHRLTHTGVGADRLRGLEKITEATWLRALEQVHRELASTAGRLCLLYEARLEVPAHSPIARGPSGR
jgi:hypothetical protein